MLLLRARVATLFYLDPAAILLEATERLLDDLMRQTITRTNWHYECARDLTAGTLQASLA